MEGVEVLQHRGEERVLVSLLVMGGVVCGMQMFSLACTFVRNQLCFTASQVLSKNGVKFYSRLNCVFAIFVPVWRLSLIR